MQHHGIAWETRSYHPPASCQRKQEPPDVVIVLTTHCHNYHESATEIFLTRFLTLSHFYVLSKDFFKVSFTLSKQIPSDRRLSSEEIHSFGYCSFDIYQPSSCVCDRGPERDVAP